MKPNCMERSIFFDFPQDKDCYDNLEEDISKSVPWYIIAHLAIEQEDPILSETAFEKVSFILEENWEEIDHELKKYLDFSDVRHRLYRGEFPFAARSILEMLRSSNKES